MCERCDPFDIEIAITGPRQLRRIVSKVQAAIADGRLRCNEFESSRALIGQKPFSQLDPEEPTPDVLRSYFECEHCGNVFGLMVETFHGKGGNWSKL